MEQLLEQIKQTWDDKVVQTNTLQQTIDALESTVKDLESTNTLLNSQIVNLNNQVVELETKVSELEQPIALKLLGVTSLPEGSTIEIEGSDENTIVTI